MTVKIKQKRALKLLQKLRGTQGIIILVGYSAHTKHVAILHHVPNHSGIVELTRFYREYYAQSPKPCQLISSTIDIIRYLHFLFDLQDLTSTYEKIASGLPSKNDNTQFRPPHNFKSQTSKLSESRHKTGPS